LYALIYQLISQLIRPAKLALFLERYFSR